jgi:cell division protein FtsQ
VNIELEGTKRLREVDVLSTSGLRLGDNLFALDTSKAESALLSSPWIASARIRRQLPGTVTVSIKEREPRAIAAISGKNFLVSAEGTPFKTLGVGDPHDLPLITGISAEALARDRRAEIARVTDALGLLQEYAGSSIAQKLPAEEVHLDGSGRASLVVGTTGTTLHLGVGPWKKKLLRAERVITKARRNGGNPSVLFVDNEAHPERVVLRVR